MQIPTTYRTLAVAAALIIGLASCSDKPAPETSSSDSTAGIVTDTSTAEAHTVSRSLPSGRFQLPTIHTPVPDLWISLPEGYEVRPASVLPNDKFFVINSTDPSLLDSTAVSTGFMQIYVGVVPGKGLSVRKQFPETPVTIETYKANWRIDDSEKLPGGKTYYKREIRITNYLAALTPKTANVPLHLLIYVAGTDSTQVAELMQAATTLTTAR